MAQINNKELETLLGLRPESMEEHPFHFCPGCGHGLVFRLVAEVIDELKIKERAICVASIGCSVNSYEYKRCHPHLVPFTYQGDGDLAAIGTAEIVHACTRGENITTIFVNNAIYGMTGGQMAPTTLTGMYSTSTPAGRKPSLAGYPIRVCEMLSTLEGTAYVARVAVHSPASVRKAKQAIKLAFRTQLAGLGMSLVEVLSPCPTNWRVEPIKAMDWLAENMLAHYPLGEYKVIEAVAALQKEVSHA